MHQACRGSDRTGALEKTWAAYGVRFARGLGGTVAGIHFEMVLATSPTGSVVMKTAAIATPSTIPPNGSANAAILIEVNARRQKLVKEHSGVVAEAVDQQRGDGFRRW